MESGMWSWYLESFFSICTTVSNNPTLRMITGIANLAIALAYFWIPAAMAVVFYKHKQDLVFPWLWSLFVMFITACGISHLVHVAHALYDDSTAYSWVEAIILIVTALISGGTAIAFTLMVPKILRMTSPKTIRETLETEVKASTQALLETNHALRIALDDQKILTREVHHRVKNNIQVIASLINMHIRRTKDADVSALEELRDRISAISAVHNQLQEVANSEFDLENFVKSLCKNFGNLFKTQAQVILQIEVDPNNNIPFEQATPKSLIINEVISNIFKHALVKDRMNFINVKLKIFNDGVRVLRIKDTGPGMPPDVHKGIGLTLIDALAVQLNGTVEWIVDGSGTEFVLTMKPIQMVEQPKYEPLKNSD